MDDIQFHWTYEIGDQTIDMGYMNVERLRHVLIDKITDEEIFPGGYWNFKRFRIFYKSFAYGGAQLSAKEAWNDVLKLKDNSKIRVPDIQRFTRQQLKLLARALDPPHGPKTDGYEKVAIAYANFNCFYFVQYLPLSMAKIYCHINQCNTILLFRSSWKTKGTAKASNPNDNLIKYCMV